MELTSIFSYTKKITRIDKHILQIILNNSYKLVALHAYDSAITVKCNIFQNKHQEQLQVDCITWCKLKINR